MVVGAFVSWREAGRFPAGFRVLAVLLGWSAGPVAGDAAPSLLAAPMQTDLAPAVRSGGAAEQVTVIGRRPAFRVAPVPGYGDGRAPWEEGRAIRDTMTGADTAAFGNAYNLASPMGSDERSNETGGGFVAPRHR